MIFLYLLIATLIGIDLAIWLVVLLQHQGVIGPLNLPGT